jgi:hypothetical protein
MKNKFTYRKDIIDHKEKVATNMLQINNELVKRMYCHDNDKISDDIIFDVYEEYNSKLRAEKYDSPMFKEYARIMHPGVVRHTSKERHHFYDRNNPMENKEVDLIDLIEVLSDWVGATQRDKNINIESALEHNFNKYNIPEDFRTLMMNTYINYLRKG